LRLTFRHFPWVVPQGTEFAGDGLHSGECIIRVAFLGDQLASDFRGAQASIEAPRAKLGVSLALAINQGLDIGEQGGPMVFHALPATGRKGIQTGEAAFQLMGAFADRHAAPAEVAFRTPLAPWPQFLDRPGHKEPASAAFEGLSRFYEQGLMGIG
jgi:hypothetical protein